MKKSTLSIICLFVLQVLFSGCEEQHGKNVICLVDMSASLDEAVLQSYQDAIRSQVIPRLGLSDRIILLPIDYGARTSSSEIFRHDFSQQSFSNDLDSELHKEKMQRRRFLSMVQDSVKPSFDRAFKRAIQERKQFNRGTDILGALHLATKYTYGDQENLIIIFSDMIHETEGLNLQKELLSAKTPPEDLYNRVQIDSLPNSRLIIFTGAKSNLTITQYNQLQAFWETIFQINGITHSGFISGSETLLEQAL